MRPKETTKCMPCAKTPQPVVGKLSAALVKIARSPELVKKMSGDIRLIGSTPEEFRKYILAEHERWKPPPSSNEGRAILYNDSVLPVIDQRARLGLPSIVVTQPAVRTTRSPGLYPLMPAPTATICPAISWPVFSAPRFCASGSRYQRMVSLPQMPQACTAASTSFGPMLGTGRDSTRRSACA